MRLAAIVSLCSICVAAQALAQDDKSGDINPGVRIESDVDQKPAAKPEPEIKQQADLDTFQLASAHRERAESMREKTNGLWQSWLVSVCEGCGPERTPYFKRRSQLSEKAPANAATAATTAQQPAPKAAAPKAVASRTATRRSVASIYEDLSDSRIDEIRRTPKQ
ncbi:hypothetical protein MKK70_21935 [Methylobacterium sp. E-041]|uniref:hypothetical protein n=1 Tax=Methylobacterium sp. E-041 TaxID=2836573 RepID=UPI001FB89B1C|nr:hypothetical protein [Methylobacterium sp. E-041]MCJ2107989.1 hypothetical protein [Methylobacterium sp. E-041]